MDGERWGDDGDEQWRSMRMAEAAWRPQRTRQRHDSDENGELATDDRPNSQLNRTRALLLLQPSRTLAANLSQTSHSSNALFCSRTNVALHNCSP